MTIGADAVYVSVNRFDESNPIANPIPFVGARVYAYNKAQMYAGQIASSVFYDVGNTASGKLADTLTPVRGAASAGATYFIAADNDQCPCSTISVWKWTGPFGASVFALRGGVSVSSYNQPPNAPQLGGTGSSGLIATNDSRNLGAYWFAGTVYGAHTVAYDTGTAALSCSTQPSPPPCLAVVQWYQIGSLEAPSLIQQGITAPADGRYRFFPDLSVDRSGNLFLGYAESSSAIYAGVAYVARAPSDPLGVLQPEVVLKPGEATVNPSDRYGDYAGESLDTDGCTVWHLEEYAPPQAGPIWGTWVSSVRFTGCSNAASVGGIAEQPDVSALPSAPPASSNDYTTVYALGGAAFAAVAAIGAGSWYMRRKRAA